MPIAQEDRDWMEHTVVKTRRWYHKSTWWNFWLWRLCQLLSILGGAVAAVLAANEGAGRYFVYFKWGAVAASFVATLSSALISTFRFPDILETREPGRVRAEDLENRTFVMLATDLDEQAKLKYKLDVCRELAAMEEEQVVRFFSLNRDVRKTDTHQPNEQMYKERLSEEEPASGPTTQSD